MKKLISILLIAVLCVSICACGGKTEIVEPSTENSTEAEIEPTTEPETDPPTEEPTTEPPLEVLTEPQPEIDLDNLVTDVFSTTKNGNTYNIPQINLDYQGVADINVEIYDKYYNDLYLTQTDESMGIDICFEISYEWFVNNGDILSLVIRDRWVGAYSDYTVYNVSITSGEKISDTAVIETKMTNDEYRSNAKAALGTYLLDITSEYEGSSEYDRTIADENIDKCVPYLGENGDLYVAATVYTMTLAGVYHYTINVSNY